MENEPSEFLRMSEIFRRMDNFSRAYDKLKGLQQNGLFNCNIEEYEKVYWLKDIQAKKWINHMRDSIKEIIELIEK